MARRVVPAVAAAPAAVAAPRSRRGGRAFCVLRGCKSGGQGDGGGAAVYHRCVAAANRQGRGTQRFGPLLCRRRRRCRRRAR